ncbi:MAG: chromosome segregation protein SMC [Candidatus Cloacimonetes bacterium]|nr:chromosome segregation protein SMC [Candidatus Cloacimonadota bacterium]
MKLSQLELTGFKSFVDTTKFSFSKGITGIVGPNGCGKSNISDAIHWVLGEQNPRKLRGNSMKDVIFKGTRKRAPHSFTEVSIIIDNDKKILPIEFEEVKITRKVYRDGESQFKINNNSCRLKDILNLFYDTGMGRRAYSFMEQSMIDELLSSNDDERRYLFEEAAGIMKYNQSQKASENKLKSIKSDLIRLEDIIVEVKHQVNTLRHQVGIAKKYQNLKQKINKILIQLEGIKFFDLQKQLKQLNNEFINIEEKLTKIIKNLSKSTKIFNQKNDELLNLEMRLKEEQNQLRDIETKINNYEKEILLNRQQIANSKSVLSENIRNIKKIESQDVSAKENLEKDIQTSKICKGKLANQKNNAQILDNKLSNIVNKITNQNTMLEELSDKINKITSKQKELLAEKSEISTKSNVISEQKDILQKRVGEFQIKIENLSKLIDKSQKSEKIHTEKLKTLVEKKSQIELKIQELTNLENKLLKQIQNSELQIKTFKKEMQQLIDWENSLIGYEEGTKKILEYFSDEKNISILSDKIEINDKYISIIETTLKNLISSAICHENDIDEVLSLLEKEGLNSNIVVENILNYKINGQNPGPNWFDSAIPLTDLIKINNSNINPKIFENIYIVPDRKTAKRLAFENFDSPNEIHFISEDGEIFSSFGVVKTNWHKSSVEGLLSRKKTIKKIQDDIQKESILLDDLNKKLKNLSSDKKQKNEELIILSNEIKDFEATLEEERKEKLQHAFQLDNLMDLQTESKYILTKTQKDLIDLENRQAEIEKLLTELPVLQGGSASGMKSNIDDLIDKQDVLRKELQFLRNQRYEIEHTLQKANIEIAKLEKDVYFISENIRKNKLIVNENTNQLKKLKVTITPKKVEIANLEKSTDELESKFRSEIEKLNKFKAKAIKTENKFHILRGEIDKLKLTMHELEFKKDIFTEDKNNIELKIQEAKLNLEHIKEDVISHFHHDLTHDDAEDYVDLDSSDLNREMAKNQKSLDNLGPINLAAIEDYATQKKRLKFLNDQMEDLIQSQNNLQQAISQLNITAEKMFLKTFSQIKENFEIIFKEVFNGGRGIVRLEDMSHPLDSKIEIFASPRGKKITNINLLSTGEKALTAIALMFSIYLVKPSPFCVLDEIDAPLDDANINRFLHLLNKFSENTQFIIITHNKRTVEAVDYLYGITMEESGISKIVSVNLS